MIGNLIKSIIISILSLIIYIVLTDKPEDNRQVHTAEEKNKKYAIIFAIISISSFVVIHMSQSNTSLVPAGDAGIREPMLNNKPPF